MPDTSGVEHPLSELCRTAAVTHAALLRLLLAGALMKSSEEVWQGKSPASLPPSAFPSRPAKGISFAWKRLGISGPCAVNGAAPLEAAVCISVIAQECDQPVRCRGGDEGFDFNTVV